MSFISQSSYSKEELIACSEGQLFTNKGDGRLPADQMLMFDKILHINDSDGEFGNGSIKAQLNINPDLWFFDCHFKEDPVMPGCLGLDAMWQLVGFYLGWTGEPGKGRALGVNSVKFTGEVLTTAKIAKYEVNMKRILKKEGAVVGLADGTLFADGKAIYQAESLKVGLFKS